MKRHSEMDGGGIGHLLVRPASERKSVKPILIEMIFGSYVGLDWLWDALVVCCLKSLWLRYSDSELSVGTA
jgi:hypothetical protein